MMVGGLGFTTTVVNPATGVVCADAGVLADGGSESEAVKVSNHYRAKRSRFCALRLHYG